MFISDYITGTVVHGLGNGHKLGFPTANVLPDSPLELEKGVYAAWVKIDGKRYKGMLYVGTRPSMGLHELTYEIHIFNLNCDLYGKSISFSIVCKVRNEKKFKDEQSLINAISADSRKVQSLLSNPRHLISRKSSLASIMATIKKAKVLWFMILALTAGSCAKIVLPTGGPQDTIPPKLLKEEPSSGSVRVSSPVIKITFDEFFTLNNPTENILISPPLEHQPTYTVQNKTLVIKFKDTLQANTTYNMVFSNCIQDYHENNKLGYYHYSFSTGDSIDDHTLTGTVMDAKTLAPCDNYFVFLYDQDIDSLPMTTMPSYLTKTQSNGAFSFPNIRPGDYKVFALKDLNGNLLYDLPNESIAFSDEMHAAVKAPVKDTLAKARGAQADTNKSSIELFAFVAADTAPTLLHYENPAAGHYQFPYKAPVMRFSATAFDRDLPHFEIINKQRDTITWYFKEPVNDTLSYLFDADGHLDTVQVTPYKPKKVQSRGSKNATSFLPVSVHNQGHRYKPLTLSFGYPVKPIDSVAITVYTIQKNHTDTTLYSITIPDTIVTALPLPMQFEDKKSYSVVIADSVFIGYNNLFNDSIKSSFVTQSEKDYGSFTLNYTVPGTGYQYIAQFQSGKSILQEDVFSASQTVTYKHLTPGNYSIIIIEDRNRNGRWDAGDYHTKQQPERVMKYPSAISIRAYWDNEESFEIPDTRK